MNPIKKTWRLIRINFILIRHGLDDIILSIPVFAPIRFMSWLNPWNWHINKKRPRGVRIREAFEELGPIFVKFGQALSTRRDLLPEDIADELAKLQDRVPPFPGYQARLTLEKIFQKPIDELFLEFDEIPLASASIAQVHAARLFDGTDVAVKILRPNVKKMIAADLALMHTFAALAERYWRNGRKLKPKILVKDFEKTLLGELDLQQEAASATTLRRHFTHSTILYIPQIYWDYTATEVMTMERIYGIPIGDMEMLREKKVNLKKLAERGVEIFFTQVFRDCFFHADMHPGNIFIDATFPENPRYLALDFGIMGTLSAFDRRYLAENLMAFFERDYHLVAELHVKSGWVPPDTRVEDFETAIRTVCEPLFDRPLKDISCAQILLRLFQTAQRFHMELQPQLVLLQKSLLNVEGLGRQLYPELDLWETAKPCLEKWLKKEMGVRSALHKLQRQLPYWVERLPDMPDMMYEILHQLSVQKKETTTAPTRETNDKLWYFVAGILGGFLVLYLALGAMEYLIK